jgi:polysaccharide export outer membrane protein
MKSVSSLVFSKASKTCELKTWRKALFSAILLSAVMLLMGAGCSTIGTGSDLPISTSTQPYVMASLDSARIESRDGSISEVIIQQDGRIDLPSGSKMVRGMQFEDFQTLLLRSYPSVKEIKIVEFRPNRVTVLGEVFHQIHTELSDGPMRVMDAIAAANGFTPLANKRRVRLVRQNAGKVEVYEFDLRETMRGRHMEENILLQPGDVITVPRNFL